MNYTALNDQQLAALLKGGDQAAFTEIYDRYWKRLFALATQKTGDADEGKEIVQQIFIRLWERRESLALQGTLAAYLSVSVKYRVINVLDRQYHQQRYLEQLPAEATVDHSTQQWLDFEEVRERLAALVEELPEKCRLVFTMSRQEGLAQKQIAEKLGISEKTVEAHLGKALKRLRAGLGSYLLSLL